MARTTTGDTAVTPWQWSLAAAPERVVLRPSPSWRVQDRLPTSAEVKAQVDARPSARRPTFYAGDVSAWDSGLLAFLLKVLEAAMARGFTMDPGGPPK